MPEKVKVLKPVLDNHLPNAPSQFDVKKSIEEESKVKPDDVFDSIKKDKPKTKKQIRNKDKVRKLYVKK